MQTAISRRQNMIKRISVIFLSLMLGALSLYAQPATNGTGQLRSVASGQKIKVTGVIVAKESDNTYIVRDTTGVDTRVIVESNASVRSNGGFLKKIGRAHV